MKVPINITCFLFRVILIGSHQGEASSVVRHMNPETKATLDSLAEAYPPEQVPVCSF